MAKSVSTIEEQIERTTLVTVWRNKKGEKGNFILSDDNGDFAEMERESEAGKEILMKLTAAGFMVNEVNINNIYLRKKTKRLVDNTGLAIKK